MAERDVSEAVGRGEEERPGRRTTIEKVLKFIRECVQL